MADLVRSATVDGLTVVCDEVPGAPATSVHLWFDVGAVDEPPELAGAAHFLEHLLFKGTARRDVGEAAATIEGLGGDLNAWTAWDETCFHAVVESREWAHALDVLVDMARHSVLDPVEIEREREVVLDEMASYDDDPHTLASDELVARLFAPHAYGRPILGTHATVKGLSRDALVGFWRRHYHPGRAILAVSGAPRLEQVTAAVRPLLTGWEAGAARRPIPCPPRAAGHVHWVDRAFASATVLWGARVPPLGHEDQAALEVLAAALGQGAAALLPAALELGSGVATDSWASLSSQRAVGLLELGLQCASSREALPDLFDVIHDVVRRGVDGETVARARRGLLTDQLFARESVETRAGDVAWLQSAFGDPNAAERHRRALAAVTPRDVDRVAATYLDPAGGTLVVVDPRADRPTLQTQWAQHVAPRPRTTARADHDGVVRVDLDGITCVIAPDDAPLVAVRVVATGGQLAEPPPRGGLAAAWGQAVTRGAGERDATTFAARADELALWLDGSSSRSLMGLSASMPADRARGGLELIGDALVEPHFHRDDVAHVLDELADDIATRVDRPAEVASNLLWSALFPDHPWQRPAGGTDASIRRVTPIGLARWHDRWVGRRNLTVAIAGGIAPDRVLAAVASWADDLPEGEVPVVPTPIASARAPRRGRAGTHQAAAVVGVRAPSVHHPHRVPLALAAQLLDSQSGRLFLRLREELGWAYSVWASAELGLGAGRFSVGITTAPDRVEPAIVELTAQLRTLAEQGPTAAELARVKRMVRGHLALRRQRVAGRAADLALATHLARPYALEQVAASLAQVTPGDIVEALSALPLDDLRVAVASPP